MWLESATILGTDMPKIDVFFALIGVAVALVPWALSELHIKLPPLLARSILGIGIFCLVLSFVIPACEWLLTPETFIYLFPGRGLGEGSAETPHDTTMRRAFVLERSGQEILQNVEITFRDDRAVGQANAEHVERYPEVGP